MSVPSDDSTVDSGGSAQDSAGETASTPEFQLPPPDPGLVIEVQKGLGEAGVQAFTIPEPNPALVSSVDLGRDLLPPTPPTENSGGSGENT